VKDDKNRAWLKAEALLKAGMAADPLVGQAGKLEPALAVTGPAGELESWLIAVSVEDRLAGFFRLSPKLELRGYSSFQRRASSLAGCPSARSWLDPQSILERARSSAAPTEDLAPPVLTYDGSPSRIAWAVKATDPTGREKTIFVAGDYVYQKEGPSGQGVGG
jgi:hypothetical protein